MKANKILVATGMANVGISLLILIIGMFKDISHHSMYAGLLNLIIGVAILRREEQKEQIKWKLLNLTESIILC